MATWNGSIYIKQDFIFPALTSAVTGIDTSVHFKVQSTNTSYDISATNGTINVGNVTDSDFGILSGARIGWLTGRRPVSGQVFPRGVYNK